MRLVSASINGFGRLVSGKINLDSKVVAIVGPNEAGKTTLLRALQFLRSDSSLAIPDRSRATEIEDSDVVVAGYFILDNEDREAVSSLNLEIGKLPERMTYQRKASGGIVNDIQPRPTKNYQPLVESIRTIFKYLETPEGKEYISRNYESQSDAQPLGKRLQSTMASLHSERALKTSITDEEKAEIASLIEDLREDENLANSPTLTSLESVLNWHQRADPWRAVHDCLKERMPDIVFFSDEDRDLRSSYGLDENIAANPPIALQSVASLGSLDLSKLWYMIESGQRGQSQTLIMQANQKLEEVYETSWNQSDVTMYFNLDGTSLEVMVRESGREITTFDERSAGLRTFAALRAFLAARKIERPPILLVDEAETHLHYNAQADLVDSFMRQKDAAKIIYTTHSPACLPPDLGVGVRAVLPRRNQPSVSDIKNNFWAGAGSAGFSPLMLAMGASAAAFTPARYVVLAEGASEMVVLPSLIRAATGREYLEYQVAPGLSEVAFEIYPDLDLEGSRVAFIVDGDKGGQDLRKRLIKGGIDGSRITSLGAITLENLIERDLYRDQMKILIGECNIGSTVPDLPDLSDDSLPWPTAIDKWALPLGLKAPSKVAVASALVEAERAIPSPSGKSALIQLDKEICAVLKIPRP
ncbi:AAA family ATPase [Rhodococcus sp. YH3-3]|uniref:AAA family ATPase n=1 Tax=Rhodococcus sp. YH3-3 TaxID=1803579 RepID=UPI0007DB693E|nr:AAA family ATPase [Rhodococcus sp. YH3-3]